MNVKRCSTAPYPCSSFDVERRVVDVAYSTPEPWPMGLGEYILYAIRDAKLTGRTCQRIAPVALSVARSRKK